MLAKVLANFGKVAAMHPAVQSAVAKSDAVKGAVAALWGAVEGTVRVLGWPRGT